MSGQVGGQVLDLSSAHLVRREKSPTEIKFVPTVFHGAILEGADALHKDLGCGNDETLQEFLASPDGKEMLRLWMLYGSRFLAQKAEQMVKR